MFGYKFQCDVDKLLREVDGADALIWVPSFLKFGDALSVGDSTSRPRTKPSKVHAKLP
jgi:hypothetical protein